MKRYATLGISAFYHDSAAAIVLHDGEIAFAAQEERFSRIKHDKRFPFSALGAAKRWAESHAIEIQDAVFYESPSLKRERQAFHLGFLRGSGSRAFWRTARNLWESDESETARRSLAKIFGPDLRLRFDCNHHLAHACSSFLVSGYDEAAAIVIDGVGEWATTSIFACRGTQMEPIWERRFPHSLGLYYSAFTQLLGFKVNSGEYKLMGLAPYGTPVYVDRILENVLRPTGDSSVFELNLQCFGFLQTERMVSETLLQLFDMRELPKEGSWSKQQLDIAASAQRTLEIICEALARHAIAITGQHKICLAGGVALNCVNNSKIHALPEVSDLFVQPASGDAGGALGAALCGARDSPDFRRRAMPVPYLGPNYSRKSVVLAARSRGIESAAYAIEDRDDYLNAVVDLLAEGSVVGWFHGRSEFGPRALGARSILSRADSLDAQRRVNALVKFRESFRPFAPVVLQDEADLWFEGCVSSPFMLETYPARAAQPAGHFLGEDANAAAIVDHLDLTRAPHPAVTHVDGSARVQTVACDGGIFWELLQRCRLRIGSSVLINTSFNVRGEPIVETPGDAMDCFLGTDIDALAIEGVLFRKAEISKGSLRASHRAIYSLD